MRAHPNILILGLVALLAACGQGDPPTDDVPSEPEKDETTEEAEPKPRAARSTSSLPATPLPSEHGLFWVQERVNLVPVAAGDPSGVHPTNADRGFGFVEPQGVLSDNARPLMVLWSGNLNVHTLRLTRFSPHARLPAQWWGAPTEGDYAWIPTANVPLDVEAVADQPGMARLQPRKELVPGFYALHDGSLVRGRTRDEVSAFYPVQIGSAETPALAWLDQAMVCFERFESEVLEAHTYEERKDQPLVAHLDRDRIVTTHGLRAERCAAALHAVLAASDNPEVAHAARAALVSLSTVIRGVPWGELDLVFESVDPALRSAPLLWYWLEIEALASAQELRREIARGETGAAGLRGIDLGGLYFDWRADRADSGEEALGRLSWIPLYLDPDAGRVQVFANRVAAGLEPMEDAASVIAAHRLKRLIQFKSRFADSPLVPAVEAYTRGVKSGMRDLANELDHSRATTGVVQLGPVHFSRPPEDPTTVGSAVDSYLRGKSKGLVRCYDDLEKRAGSPQQGLVIAKISVEQAMFGGSATARVMRPVSAPATAIGDQRFVDCLSTSLDGTPATLSASSMEAIVPIAFNGDRVSLERIR